MSDKRISRFPIPELNDLPEDIRERILAGQKIWDIGAITAFFSPSNRMANVTTMRPNDEFYLLGRIPKE